MMCLMVFDDIRLGGSMKQLMVDLLLGTVIIGLLGLFAAIIAPIIFGNVLEGLILNFVPEGLALSIARISAKLWIIGIVLMMVYFWWQVAEKSITEYRYRKECNRDELDDENAEETANDVPVNQDEDSDNYTYHIPRGSLHGRIITHLARSSKGDGRIVQAIVEGFETPPRIYGHIPDLLIIELIIEDSEVYNKTTLVDVVTEDLIDDSMIHKRWVAFWDWAIDEENREFDLWVPITHMDNIRMKANRHEVYPKIVGSKF